MKTLLKTLVVLAFAVSTAVSFGQTVLFSSIGTPSFTTHILDPYPAKTAFYVATFNLQITAIGGDVVLPVFTFADTNTPNNLGFISATIYQNGTPYSELSWASFNIVTGTTSIDSFGRMVVRNGESTTIEMSLLFGVSDPTMQAYGIKVNSLSYAFGAGNPIDLSFALTGQEWTAGSVPLSAIPEPSTYAAIFGAAALGLAFLKRRKPNQIT